MNEEHSDGQRIKEIQRVVHETQRIAHDTQQGLGAVQLALSKHHGDFMLLKHTVDNMAAESLAHCKDEDAFRVKNEGRLRILEDWALRRDAVKLEIERRVNRNMAILAIGIPVVYKLMETLLKEVMK